MAQKPNAPNGFVVSSYTNNRVAGRATANWNGGATILEWQIGWSNFTSPNHVQFWGNLDLDGTGFIGGLNSGETYYFWSRQRNAYGWSELSVRTSRRTRDKPDAPKPPVATLKSQTATHVQILPNWNGDSPILGYQLVWGLSPTNSDNIIGGGESGGFGLSGLEPGRTYYFWGRATNAYGTSEWSARSQTTLIAGAWVNVGGVWRRAVPYVKVGGVWKLTRSWVKQNGVWKELSD